MDIRHTWDEVLEALGLPATDQVRRLAECPVLTAYQGGGVAEDDYVKELGELLHVRPEQARSVHAAILKEEFAGMSEIVADLKARGLVTGCLSNTNALHWHALTMVPSIANLDVRVASHLCGANKPAAAAYAAFEREAGVLPEEVVFFDDGPVNVEAAVARGWAAFLVTSDLPPAQQIRPVLQRTDLL